MLCKFEIWVVWLLILKILELDNEFKLLKILVDVAFKLLIWVVCPLILKILELDNEFKLFKILVDVAFILFIDK